ncbi:hypothetical protein BGZ49_001015 [Haplosporangium sp. Z 27]|nr:hypothetical protein BGZ49_001015 [Haplosporangium sp. Z 27]
MQSDPPGADALIIFSRTIAWNDGVLAGLDNSNGGQDNDKDNEDNKDKDKDNENQGEDQETSLKGPFRKPQFYESGSNRDHLFRAAVFLRDNIRARAKLDDDNYRFSIAREGKDFRKLAEDLTSIYPTLKGVTGPALHTFYTKIVEHGNHLKDFVLKTADDPFQSTKLSDIALELVDIDYELLQRIERKKTDKAGKILEFDAMEAKVRNAAISSQGTRKGKGVKHGAEVLEEFKYPESPALLPTSNPTSPLYESTAIAPVTSEAIPEASNLLLGKYFKAPITAPSTISSPTSVFGLAKSRHDRRKRMRLHEVDEGSATSFVSRQDETAEAIERVGKSFEARLENQASKIIEMQISNLQQSLASIQQTISIIQMQVVSMHSAIQQNNMQIANMQLVIQQYQHQLHNVSFPKMASFPSPMPQ